MATGQAERLMSLLAELLVEAGAGWSDLAGIGVCTGPGNFTGVRIGVAAARGLALGLGRPAIGVSRFDALAFGHPAPVLVIIEARGDQVHARLGDGAPERLTHAALAARRWPPGIRRIDGDTDPDAVARIALSRLGTPQPRPAPLYLRDADAAPMREPVPAILP